MKRKHFVLGLIFNSTKDEILLVEKKRPEWQAGYWNGIGGKIKIDETPAEAMNREIEEEMFYKCPIEYVITFVCPGGTVFVFRAICTVKEICFKQMEDERLATWPVNSLPLKIMNNLLYLVPLSLSSLQFPIILQQNELGVTKI